MTNKLVLCLPLLAAAMPAGAATDAVLHEAGTRMSSRIAELMVKLPLLGIAAVVILLFWWLARWIGNARWPYAQLRNPLMRDLASQVVQTAVLLAGVLVALDVLNATALVGAVLGTAGVVGLALGFAFKDVVENYLAGILLSMRQPFSANDLISVEGFEGKVIRLTSRATILMTLDGNHVRLPNALVFKSPMTNYTRNPLRRFDFIVGVGGNEDLVGAQSLGVEALASVPGVLAEPAPWAMLEPPGDSNIGVHFFGWIDQSRTSLPRAQSAAIRRVTSRLITAGIDMPEPIYRVQVTGQGLADTAAPSEAAAQRARPAQQETPNDKDAVTESTHARDDIDAQIAEDRRREAGDRHDLLNVAAPKE
ncbi:MAG: mechanosensitive ion channel domain-containing protein [Pseudomonadota bacterium]|jgi:small conductance mechanosensitive channel|nr:mechanosensitive ion channel domain-containing protein [Pseudomonadota bacterium]